MGAPRASTPIPICTFCETYHSSDVPCPPMPPDVPEEEEQIPTKYESHGFVMVEITRARIDAAVKIILASLEATGKNVTVSGGSLEAANKFLIDQFKVD